MLSCLGCLIWYMTFWLSKGDTHNSLTCIEWRLDCHWSTSIATRSGSKLYQEDKDEGSRREPSVIHQLNNTNTTLPWAFKPFINTWLALQPAGPGCQLQNMWLFDRSWWIQILVVCYPALAKAHQGSCDTKYEVRGFRSAFQRLSARLMACDWTFESELSNESFRIQILNVNDHCRWIILKRRVWMCLVDQERSTT
jgi:hypothetical protein